jgi:outer membrane immunogenic protein
MRHFLLTTAALAALSTGALAADLPVIPAPPAYVPPPAWTGFYAGLNAGYSFGTSSNASTFSRTVVDNIATNPAWLTPFGYTALANSGNAHVNQSGFIGGGQIGYNYQWGSNVVAGLEADIEGAGIRGTGNYNGRAEFGPDAALFNDTAVGSGTVTASVDWMGTVRGRLGYLFTPTMLVYATGGLAYGGVHASASHNLAFTDLDTTTGVNNFEPTFGGGTSFYSSTRVGWTVGGGLEWMFTPNWSVKAEALYYNLGSSTFAANSIGATDGLGNVLFSNTPVTRVSYNGVIARAGINYHFNWGAPPVVARY